MSLCPSTLCRDGPSIAWFGFKQLVGNDYSPELLEQFQADWKGAGVQHVLKKNITRIYAAFTGEVPAATGCRPLLGSYLGLGHLRLEPYLC